MHVRLIAHAISSKNIRIVRNRLSSTSVLCWSRTVEKLQPLLLWDGKCCCLAQFRCIRLFGVGNSECFWKICLPILGILLQILGTLILILGICFKNLEYCSQYCEYCPQFWEYCSQFCEYCSKFGNTAPNFGNTIPNFGILLWVKKIGNVFGKKVFL